jgi:lipoate-protein ligase A
MINLQAYNLPDQQLLSGNSNRVFVWLPDKTYVILGQRDSIETAVVDDIAIRENAVVMQRPSGGHSVVLTPKTIVVSMISYSHSLTAIKSFFQDCNLKIIAALEAQGVSGLSIQGISDIVLNGRKIVGSSMYRGKDFLFFHAVLNFGESADYISQFLKHPATEPEYRQKRKHSEFITSLKEQGYEINYKTFENSIMHV